MPLQKPPGTCKNKNKKRINLKELSIKMQTVPNSFATSPRSQNSCGSGSSIETERIFIKTRVVESPLGNYNRNNLVINQKKQFNTKNIDTFVKKVPINVMPITP